MLGGFRRVVGLIAQSTAAMTRNVVLTAVRTSETMLFTRYIPAGLCRKVSSCFSLRNALIGAGSVFNMSKHSVSVRNAVGRREPLGSPEEPTNTAENGEERDYGHSSWFLHRKCLAAHPVRCSGWYLYRAIYEVQCRNQTTPSGFAGGG